MGKRRTRQVPPPQSFQLCISGPKTILPRAVTVTTQLDVTWYQLLNDEMGLEITPEAGFFVCTSRYSRNDPDNESAWCAELDDRIGDYIEKFEKNWRLFTARLSLKNPQNWKGNASMSSANTSRSTPTPQSSKKKSPLRNSSAINRPNKPGRSSAPSAAPHRRPNIVISTGSPAIHSRTPSNLNRRQISNPRGRKHIVPVSKQLRNLRRAAPSPCARRTRSEGPSAPEEIEIIPEVLKIEVADQQNCVEVDLDDWNEEPAAVEDPEDQNVAGNEVIEEGEGGSDSGHGDEDDVVSMCTAATEEEVELRQQGIQVEDVKSLAAGQMSRFSNAYMLRVRNEMRKLKRNNMWDRCVSRAPLACYLLQEILKD